ncbi:MAG: WYL domain-containing protein [Bacteroidia bacterium]|nr:WYL domain-containing protein [Bacteroidia bacterium]
MPINKNAYLRYRIIDQCLNNKYKKYTRHNLLDKIKNELCLDKLTIHQIDKDIKSMVDNFDAPIKNDRTYFHYYYSKPFSLEGFILDDEEEAALHMSLSVLDVLKDTKYAASYKTLIQRLVTQASGYQKTDIIEFEQPVKHAESYLFDKLYESIIDEQTLLITYKVYGKEAKEHTISPYMIKEYKNRFYLVARKHSTEKTELIYCFGMDRIIDVKKSKEGYLITKGFNSKNYFKDSFGITRKLNEEPLELVMRFNEKNLHYVLSNPLHHSQKIVKQTKNSLTISICVYESDELNMQVLSYGAGLEVLSPVVYKDYIAGIIKEMSDIYYKK